LNLKEEKMELSNIVKKINKFNEAVINRIITTDLTST
jgi:hypothetical protein